MPAISNVEEAYTTYSSKLAALGWAVELERYADGEAIRLRSKFKNGKLRKGSDVILQFEELTWNQVVQPDGSFARENIRPRERPWIVRSKSFNAAQTYTHAATALDAFLEEAWQRAPAREAPSK